MSIYIKQKLKTQSLDYRLWDFWVKFRQATRLSGTKLNCCCWTCSIDMHDWFVIHYWAALQGNAQSKNGGRLVCAAKRQNGGQIRLLPNFWFLRKRGGSFQIKIMLGGQNNIVWTPKRKLLLSLMIRARKLSEFNPI